MPASSAGLRTFSGLTVGLLGSIATVHVSLACAAAAFMAITLTLLLRSPDAAAPETESL